MEKFLRRLTSGCRNLTCNNNNNNITSKTRNNRKNINRSVNMSNSVTIDIGEQLTWDEQGKPLMKLNGVVSPTASHRASSSSSLNGNLPKNVTTAPTSPIREGKYSEIPRFALSYAYMFLLGLANSLVVIVAHDWAPDRKQYPPLPDLLLDNVPYVPWAFHACEGIGGVMFLIFVTIMCFHKHRFVILRRLFIIYGSVLFMRCPAMLLTSLSIPSQHLQCEPMLNDSMWSKLQRAGDLYLKFGMSSQGVRTCGDYMFSGHTVFIALLNFVITEYTPVLLLHVLSWALTLFALSFIMLAHVHYSIDVLIAFYLCALYFNYYHTLASYLSPVSLQDSGNANIANSNSWLRRCCFLRQRLRIWVPFYSYLERGTGGAPLPHEFESPITALLRFTRSVKHRVIAGKSRFI